MTAIFEKEEEAINSISRAIADRALTVRGATEFLNKNYPIGSKSRDVMASILSIAVSISEMTRKTSYTTNEVFFLSKVENRLKEIDCPVCRTIATMCGEIVAHIAMNDLMEEDEEEAS